MDREYAATYRPRLVQDPPDFMDVVATPWVDVPDLAAYNDSAYRRIVRALSLLHRASEKGTPSSKGVLILGEAGTGKTHGADRACRGAPLWEHMT